MKINKLIIANCSGFYGDRFSAAKEMVQGKTIDILTGDYLAELTMALLFRMKVKDPKRGYVPSFLLQMEDIMKICLDRDIKIVTNAGGLNPSGLARDLKKLSRLLGLNLTIAYIEGDNLIPEFSYLQELGEKFRHLDKNINFKTSGLHPITANAYLGGFGITKALEQGADIVVGGRIADAALVAGPAAWKFRWGKEDFDQLAGAYTAGHLIECGTQVTGGNYPFMDEVPSYDNIGFPIVEIEQDGSFIITKQEGTGGLVSKGTVTGQLLYEIREPTYLTPDVKVRFDTLKVKDIGNNRVKVSDVKGEPPNQTTKVCINTVFGFKNSMTVILTGLDIAKKAKIVENIVFGLLGGKNQFAKTDVSLIKSGNLNPIMNNEAFSYLRISVMDKDKLKVGKLFASAIVEAALSTIPGFTLTGPPSKGVPAILHWPALVSLKNIRHRVLVNGEIHKIKPLLFKSETTPQKNISSKISLKSFSHSKSKLFIRIPFGRFFAARSGDKGGNANLGVWAKDKNGFFFLNEYLTINKLKKLLPDMSKFEVERYVFPNLFALNFYIKGLLEDGVLASLRIDPQAKTLGEYLRMKIVKIPVCLISH